MYMHVMIYATFHALARAGLPMSSTTNSSILLTFSYEVEAQELQQSSMTATFKLQASM